MKRIYQRKLNLEECVRLARMVPKDLWERKKEPGICTYKAHHHKLGIYVWAVRNAAAYQYYYGMDVSFEKLVLGKHSTSPHNVYSSNRYEMMKAAYEEIVSHYKRSRGIDRTDEMQTALAKTRSLLRKRK